MAGVNNGSTQNKDNSDQVSTEKPEAAKGDSKDEASEKTVSDKGSSSEEKDEKSAQKKDESKTEGKKKQSEDDDKSGADHQDQEQNDSKTATFFFFSYKNFPSFLSYVIIKMVLCCQNIFSFNTTQDIIFLLY